MKELGGRLMDTLAPHLIAELMRRRAQAGGGGSRLAHVAVRTEFGYDQLHARIYGTLRAGPHLIFAATNYSPQGDEDVSLALSRLLGDIAARASALGYEENLSP